MIDDQLIDYIIFWLNCRKMYAGDKMVTFVYLFSIVMALIELG